MEQSEHRPYVSIVVDVLDMLDDATPRQIAEAGWSDIKDWVASGYLPVVEVVTEDGSFDVDLEEVEGEV